MFKDNFFLAIGNVRHRGVRSWLTMLGIFIGIAAVVSLISMGAGLRTAVTGQFGTLDTDILTIQNAQTAFGPPGATAVAQMTTKDLEVVEKVQGVSLAVARLVRAVKIGYNDEVYFNFIADIPEDEDGTELIYNSLNVGVASGDLLDRDDKGKIVVGDEYVEDVFSKKVRVGSIIKIQGQDFEVIGILEKSSSFILNDIILILNDDLEDLLDIKDEIDMIVVRVDDESRITETAERIEEALRKDRDQKPGEEDFAVQTPEQGLEAVNTILTVINTVIFAIAAISLLVGGIGIANTMYTSVLERTREIGTMKAVGAKNKDIATIFLIESGLLGLVGGIIGALIGLGLAFLASYFANQFFEQELFTITFSYPLIIGAILFSFSLGVISGLIPSFQASKLKPVEALRE